MEVETSIVKKAIWASAIIVTLAAFLAGIMAPHVYYLAADTFRVMYWKKYRLKAFQMCPRCGYRDQEGKDKEVLPARW